MKDEILFVYRETFNLVSLISRFVPVTSCVLLLCILPCLHSILSSHSLNGDDCSPLRILSFLLLVSKSPSVLLLRRTVRGPVVLASEVRALSRRTRPLILIESQRLYGSLRPVLHSFFSSPGVTSSVYTVEVKHRASLIIFH